MIDKTMIKLSNISDKLLDIVYDHDQFTTSDLQGAVEAQVRIAYMLGKKKGNLLSQSSVDFINDLLDNEYNSTDMDDDYRDEIQDVQSELDEIGIKEEIKL